MPAAAPMGRSRHVVYRPIAVVPVPMRAECRLVEAVDLGAGVVGDDE